MLTRRYIALLSIFALLLLLVGGCSANTPRTSHHDRESSATSDTLDTLSSGLFPTSAIAPTKTSAFQDPIKADVMIEVEAIPQYPDYPTGCESVTAVMALRHTGISVTVDEFIDRHLVCDDRFYDRNGLLYGPDPYAVFVGDPRSEYSYGCMAPVIENALNSCVGGEKEVRNTTGKALLYLCRTYIDKGIPVILWATMEMHAVREGNTWYLPDGRPFTWPAGEHCLLLVGYSDSAYFFNDPLLGRTVAYDKESVERNYRALGKQSLVIE